MILKPLWYWATLLRLYLHTAQCMPSMLETLDAVVCTAREGRKGLKLMDQPLMLGMRISNHRKVV